MPHGGTGFLYYEYTYRCPWKSIKDGSTGTEEVFHTAVYTRVKKESHPGQTEWFKGCAIKAIENDVNGWLANVDRNNNGMIYERFNRVYIQQKEFMYCEKLPPHTDGKKKGQPYGKEIKK